MYRKINPQIKIATMAPISSFISNMNEIQYDFKIEKNAV